MALARLSNNANIGWDGLTRPPLLGVAPSRGVLISQIGFSFCPHLPSNRRLPWQRANQFPTEFAEQRRFPRLRIELARQSSPVIRSAFGPPPES